MLQVMGVGEVDRGLIPPITSVTRLNQNYGHVHGIAVVAMETARHIAEHAPIWSNSRYPTGRGIPSLGSVGP